MDVFAVILLVVLIIIILTALLLFLFRDRVNALLDSKSSKILAGVTSDGMQSHIVDLAEPVETEI